MTIENKLMQVVDSANRLTEVVNSKMTVIDNHLINNTQRVDNYLSEANHRLPYINLFRNAFATETDAQGNLVFPLALYSVKKAEVIKYNEIPKHIINTLPAKFNSPEVFAINCMRVIFNEHIGHQWWIVSNPVMGWFTGGFGHAYIVSGEMRGLKAGQSGATHEYSDRSSRCWHIDFNYGVAPNTEVYLFAPYIVAGKCPDPALVQFIPERSVQLGMNI